MRTTREGGQTEALVTIDGVVLSDAEVTTLRMAVSGLVSELHDPKKAAAFGAHAAAHRVHGSDLEVMLVNAGNRPDRLRRRRAMVVR